MTSGGSKRELFEFTKRLKRDGYELHLFTNLNEKNSYLDLSYLVDQVHKFEFNMTKNIVFPLPFLKSLVNLCISFLNIYKLINISKLMANYIDNNNFKFVFIHHNKYYVQSPFIIKYLKARSIYFCAEPQRKIYDKELFNKLKTINLKSGNYFKYLYSFLTKSFDNICKRFLLRKIKKYDFENINKCDLVLTNSYFSKENILSSYGIESTVIHLGGDIFKNKSVPTIQMSQSDFTIPNKIKPSNAPIKWDFL